MSTFQDYQHKIEWMKHELVPQMIKNGQLVLDEKCSDCVNIDHVEVKPLDASGTFSLTIPFKVHVRLVCAKDEKLTKDIYLVIKITPEVEDSIYIGCQFDLLFENETTAYTEIIPAIGHSELYPKYFYSHRKEKEAVMVLGDFSKSGWKMAPKVYNLPLEYILLAVKELGRFHGECYALKENDPEAFQHIISKFKESRYSVDVVDPIWDEMMRIAPIRATNSVRNSEEFKDKITEEFLKSVEDSIVTGVMAFQKLCVKPREPLAVICHGDFLRNNIAFNYKDDDPDHPTQAMIFDFQTLRYASPMIDLSVFLANSTSYEVRLNHFDEIFKTYCYELVSELLQNCTAFTAENLPPHYTYESFLKEFAQYYPFGFCIASSFLPALYSPSLCVFPADETALELFKTAGGEPLDYELRAMLFEIYTLQKKYGLKFTVDRE